jgi:thymidylate synthase (FAD)
MPAKEQTEPLERHGSQPRLYVIGRPSFDIESFVTFLSRTGVRWDSTQGASDAENVVEVAGRICYMSFGPRQRTKPNRAYIANLIRQGHESVLEHVSWTFLLDGVSRAFSHQFVRHRVGFSFSQLSQQYHEENNAVFIEPRAIQDLPELSRLWHETVARCREAYRNIASTLAKADLVDQLNGKEREALRALRGAARSVLPNATETKIVFTANARALRHFLALRGSVIGDEEMRLVSRLIFDRVQQEAPSLFQDFRCRMFGDGLPLVCQEGVDVSGGD